MPNYSKTINEFSKVEVSLSELQTTIENLEYLSQAALSTDKQLLNEICEKSIDISSSKMQCLWLQIQYQSWSTEKTHSLHRVIRNVAGVTLPKGVSKD